MVFLLQGHDRIFGCIQDGYVEQPKLHDPSKPASDAFNSQSFNSRFISDGLKAYTQALLYYITSDETYRANAMHIIRIWSRMDPAKYQYFTDAQIHVGIPLNRK